MEGTKEEVTCLMGETGEEIKMTSQQMLTELKRSCQQRLEFHNPPCPCQSFQVRGGPWEEKGGKQEDVTQSESSSLKQPRTAKAKSS